METSIQSMTSNSSPAELDDEPLKRAGVIARMDHDIRTPLNAIIGLAGLLQASKAIPEKEKKYVDTLKSSADNLLGLVGDLLNFVRDAAPTSWDSEHASVGFGAGLPGLTALKTTGHKNVLIVDDYDPNVLVTEAMLDQLGYHYDIAKNGEHAISLYKLNSYDLVLMDVQMEGCDGFEATRRIREFERDTGKTHTPIVAITGLVCEQDRENCMSAGMDDFIPKPFHPSELAQKLANFIPAVRTARAG